MARKKRIPPIETIGLKLTRPERELLIGESHRLPEGVEAAIRATPLAAPVQLTLDAVDQLADWVKKASGRPKAEDDRSRWDRISKKLATILDRTPGEPGPTE